MSVIGSIKGETKAKVLIFRIKIELKGYYDYYSIKTKNGIR